MNMHTTELSPMHRYRRKIMKTSLCTHPASMPVPTLLTTHLLIFRGCCSPCRLATRVAAGYCETVQNVSSEHVAHVGREDEPSATTTASAKAFEYLRFSDLLRNDPQEEQQQGIIVADILESGERLVEPCTTNQLQIVTDESSRKNPLLPKSSLHLTSLRHHTNTIKG